MPKYKLLKQSAVFGFSLIELLIVMAVIAILVALIFPVIMGAREKARKKQAVVEAHNLALALKAYYMEFGQWPNQSQAALDTTYFTNNYQVILPLIGYNPRGKIFLTLQFSTFAGANVVAGRQTDFATNFIDPWGVPYVICLDENMDVNCQLSVSNVLYTNFFSTPPLAKYYFAGLSTNAIYSVANANVAVGSFAGGTNVSPAESPPGAFQVETWSEPR